MTPAAPNPNTNEGTLSLLQALHALLSELPGLVSDRVNLFALELSRATQALAHIVVLALCALVLGTTAWLALCGGLALAALHAGVHWGVVVALVVVVNAALAYGAIRRALALTSLLHLTATLRHLTVPVSKLPALPINSDQSPSL